MSNEPDVAPFLTNEQIKTFIESAFSPLRCAAEIWDYDQKIRFKVFSQTDEVLLACPEAVLSKIRDTNALHSLIVDFKQRINLSNIAQSRSGLRPPLEAAR